MFWKIVGDIGHSESIKLSLSRIIVDALLFLERDVKKFSIINFSKNIMIGTFHS